MTLQGVAVVERVFSMLKNSFSKQQTKSFVLNKKFCLLFRKTVHKHRKDSFSYSYTCTLQSLSGLMSLEYNNFVFLSKYSLNNV